MTETHCIWERDDTFKFYLYTRNICRSPSPSISDQEEPLNDDDSPYNSARSSSGNNYDQRTNFFRVANGVGVGVDGNNLFREPPPIYARFQGGGGGRGVQPAAPNLRDRRDSLSPPLIRRFPPKLPPPPTPLPPGAYSDLPANFRPPILSYNAGAGGGNRRLPPLGPLLRTQSPSPPPSSASRGSSAAGGGGGRSASEHGSRSNKSGSRSNSYENTPPPARHHRNHHHQHQHQHRHHRNQKHRHRRRAGYEDGPIMSKLLAGPVRTNIYDDEVNSRGRDGGGGGGGGGGGSDRSERSESRMSNRSSRASTPPERPSWGFASSRAASRMEGEYLNGEYDSDESDFGSRSGRYYDSDDDDGGDFGSSRRSKAGLIRGRSKSPSTNRSNRAPRARSRVRDGIDGYRATRVTLYKNGDPWFGSMEYRFIPGKDIKNLDGLFVKVNEKMDFSHGISFMFDTDGSRITSIDQVESGGEYVMASSKKFTPANYGRTGEAFEIDGGAKKKRNHHHHRLKRISYNSKKAGTSSAPAAKPGSGDGKIIKIVSAEDYSVHERVLLNLRTTQSFEDVVKDLGQVLKIRKANKLYTRRGKEIKSFSHLKMDFSSETTFFVSSGSTRILGYESEEEDSEDEDEDYDISPTRRQRGRGGGGGRATSEPAHNDHGRGGRRSRSTSRARSASPDAIKIRVKGGKRTVYPPSGGHDENVREPSEKMELDWVYGYRGRKERRNLWLVAEGEILYYVGSVAVVYNRVNETQKHYTEHTEDIQCMDLHPSREYVVSGQRRGKGSESWAHIRVWSVTSLETKVTLGMGELNYGVSAVAFSIMSRGDFVVCVDETKDNTMSIWNWKKKELVGRTSTDHSVTNGCAFHPFDDNLSITYGKNHLVFWNRKRDGFFERSDLLKGGSSRHFTCHAFLESGDFVAGDTDGMISTYSVSNEGEYYMSKEIEAHRKGGVACLLSFNEHTVISGGDRDGTIVSWDSTRDFEKMSEASLPEHAGCAKAVAPQKSAKNSADNSVYVGTADNVILEGSIQRNFRIIVWGHRGELRGLAPHPDDLAFVTAGADRTVAKWRKQRVVWLLALKAACLSASYHPSGAVVAVGTDDGHLVVLDGETGSHLVTIKACGAALPAVRYSPGGDLVALAAQTGSVYLYTVSRDGRHYKKFGKMAGRSQSLLHLDWNKKGDLLRTVSADNDVSFWNVKTSKVCIAPNLFLCNHRLPPGIPGRHFKPNLKSVAFFKRLIKCVNQYKILKKA